MKLLEIVAGPFTFKAKLEMEDAPKTCERFIELLPFENKVILTFCLSSTKSR
ncbi:MAG: hypothetical protein AAF485_23740 [Chloroflexota bacterium]